MKSISNKFATALLPIYSPVVHPIAKFLENNVWPIMILTTLKNFENTLGGSC
jgi:hypothetical protein